MKKNDVLFKKVDFFERLAIYGNRRSFLQALAQDSQTDYQNSYNNAATNIYNAKLKLKQARNILQQNHVVSWLKYDFNDVNTTPSNIQEMKKQISNLFIMAKNLRNEDDRSVKQLSLEMASFLNTANSEIKKAEYSLPGIPQQTENSSLTNEEIVMPATEIHGDKPIVNFPKIDKDKQRALSKILTVKGLGLPLEIDGVLGTETKKAIDLVRDKLELYAFNDDEVLTWAKMTAELPEYK